MGQNDNIHAGHRERMRQEFLARGLAGMPDHRVMELLLFFTIRRQDVNALAHRLINNFGSLSGVLLASFDQLVAVPGVGPETATHLRLVGEVIGRFLQTRAKPSVKYETRWQFQELLEPEFAGARTEKAVLICLDKGYRLLGCRNLSDGTTDAVSITARKIMEAALGCSASIVVLAHNHLSGLPLPSAQDVMTTSHLVQSLKPLGIQLLDHLIVSDGNACSMRESGYFDDF